LAWEGSKSVEGRRFNFESRKFKEMILYFSQRGIDEGLVIGSTKLNKLMAFSDFEAFAELGAPITGATYQRLPLGPAARQLVPMRNQLLGDKEARWKENQENEWDDVLIPISTPNLKVFEAPQLRIMDRVFVELRPYNAKASSDLSHERLAGWRVLKNKETIPYETFVVSSNPPPKEVMDRLRVRILSGNWR
jgi:hypothetical protein